MLKTNSKKAKENLKNYILENFDPSSYEVKTPTNYKEVCKMIYEIMESEKYYAREATDYQTFKSWCQGLPSLLNTCYYYNREAKEDLKNILEETEEEANKYTEEQAEELLTQLLYREIMANK